MLRLPCEGSTVRGQLWQLGVHVGWVTQTELALFPAWLQSFKRGSGLNQKWLWTRKWHKCWTNIRQGNSDNISFFVSGDTYYVPAAKCMCISANLIPTATYEVGTMLTPISQRKKLSLSQVRRLAKTAQLMTRAELLRAVTSAFTAVPKCDINLCSTLTTWL